MEGKSTFITDPRLTCKCSIWLFLKIILNIYSNWIQTSKWIDLNVENNFVVFCSFYLIILIGEFKDIWIRLMINFFRSHDDFVELPSGIFEASDSFSSYASQQKVFDDLGRNMLKNAFDGK